MSDIASYEEIRDAFRIPRGRYVTARASQLSGVPGPSLERWARAGLLEPDFPDRPIAWSYRDLVFARLFAYLRAKGMKPDLCRQQVQRLRKELVRRDDGNSGLITGDGLTLTREDEEADAISGQGVIKETRAYLGTFNLFEILDIEEFGRRKALWGPDLRQPSDHTRMSPWVMNGDPCVDLTRIPSATLYGLHVHRGLEPTDIIRLYPDLEVDAVTDALKLERRLRRLEAA